MRNIFTKKVFIGSIRYSIAYVSVIDNKDFSFNDYNEGEYIKATFQMIQETYLSTIIATNIQKVSEDSVTDNEVE